MNKKKLVFIGGIGLVIIAMLAYGMMLMEEEPETLQEDSPDIPELEKEPEEFESRLEAVEQLREERKRNIPSIYDEKYTDSNTSLDPYVAEQEKKRLMDSILESGPEPEASQELSSGTSERSIINNTKDTLEKHSAGTDQTPLGQGHPEFFLSKTSNTPGQQTSNQGILAMVDGDQVVRSDERLVLRLMEDAVFAGDSLAAYSRIYANCSFKANRLLLEIQAPFGETGSLQAYDLSDGQPGIYVENSFRGAATTEVLDDVIRDINISGIPQVRGLKNLFQRDNRKVRVKVLHQYQLILKPKL